MRLAILIDAENVAARYWPKIRRLAGALPNANPTIQRIFGDFSDGKLAQWIKMAEPNGLEVVMQFAGRNATDMTLAIHAMDLLHDDKVNGFCIVSSDGGFLGLAQRIRAAGLPVYFIGQTVSQAISKVCTKAIELKDDVESMPQQQKTAPQKMPRAA